MDTMVRIKIRARRLTAFLCVVVLTGLSFLSATHAQFSTVAFWKKRASSAPLPGAWTALNNSGAPVGAAQAAIMWDGTLTAVYGGIGPSGYTYTGGRYNPAGAGTWSSLTTAVQTYGATWGTNMTKALFFGGMTTSGSWPNITWTSHNTGKFYNLATNSWTTMTTSGAPSTRISPGVIFNGEKAAVFGGLGYSGTAATPTITLRTDGGIYDTVGLGWTSIPATGGPGGRSSPYMAWIGNKIYVWGGWDNNSQILTDGGIYDTVAGTWGPMNTTGSPTGYTNLIVAGTKLILWGGCDSSACTAVTNTGAIYDTTSNTWSAMSTVGAPSARYNQAAVWTGSRMIVWSGYTAGDKTAVTNTGGGYDPLTNTWETLNITGAPSARAGASAVWTGTSMIVWGGMDASNNFFNDGGILAP